MNHLATSVGLLSAVAFLGLDACKSRAGSSRASGAEGGAATSAESLGASSGGAAGMSTDAAPGGAGGDAADATPSCPYYDPEATWEHPPVLLHPATVYELFVFGVVDGFAYFVEGFDLRRVPVDGGPVETVGPIYPSWVRMAGTERVVWVQPDPESDALQIVSAPLTDPTDIRIAVAETPSVSQLLVDDDNVYWATTGPYDVYRAPLEGGDPELLVEEAQPLGAVLHDGHYYWLDLTSDHLERVPVDGGEREELAPILYGGPMAAADGAIYWGDTSLSTIEKWSPDAGRVKLARAIDPMQIAVADDTVYWSQGLLGGKVKAIGVDGENERDVLCDIRSRPSIVVTDDHVLVGGGSGLFRVTR